MLQVNVYIEKLLNGTFLRKATVPPENYFTHKTLIMNDYIVQ